MGPTPCYHPWQKVMEMVRSCLCYCLMLLQVFSFVQTCLQPRPTASHKEHHACKTSVEILFRQVSLPLEYFRLNCSVLHLSPQVKWLIC